jgi:predicted metalloprotease with PDZ domain
MNEFGRSASHDPTALPEEPAIAAPADVEYPGTISLNVDATDLQRGIFRIRQVIPVSGPGPITLLYPKWLPGYHAPHNFIELLGGLDICAHGKRLAWRRDPVEMYAFHTLVPEGAHELEVELQFLSPTAPDQGRIVVTPQLLNLQWSSAILYPAGYYSRQIRVQAAVKLPSTFQLACALPVESTDGPSTKFAPVPLDVLIDSPLMAGSHCVRSFLDERECVRLNLLADSPELLTHTSAQHERHCALVTQADKLFGPRPFERFEFLVALSDELGTIGVEHHASCEIGTRPGYFRDWQKSAPNRSVIAHEYVHAWNGKFRRGADSWTPSFERPIRNSLMWVYEGQTQYWSEVLAARSGLWTREEALASLALTAAISNHREGGRWRPMSDTTRDPIIADRSPLPWPSWQRSEDYYSEGQLVWLEVDTLLRQISGEKCSLDDFARAFFGTYDGSCTTSTYTMQDVVATLTRLADHDWRRFFLDRLEAREAGAPLGGLAGGGYELVYRETPTEFAAQLYEMSDVVCHRFSLGITVTTSGLIQEVIWESPAFRAGLTAGTNLLAVNGRSFSPDELTQAVAATATGAAIELLTSRGKKHAAVTLDYHGGARFPHLAPVEGERRRLDEILTPR